VGRDYGRKWLYAGGSASGERRSEWDLRPIYASLAAAYGWTFGDIDELTLADVNDLTSQWKDHPPTNILLKGLIEGLAGGSKPTVDAAVDMPPEAFEAMQNAALAGIAARAGNRIPIMAGRDPGLPKAAPVFDLDTLRQRNAEAKARLEARAKEKAKGTTGV
jgi:hypothetical protein